MPRIPEYNPSPISTRVPGAQINVGAATRSAEALTQLVGVGSNIAQELLKRRRESEIKTFANSELKDYELASQRKQQELLLNSDNGKTKDGKGYFEAYNEWEKDYLDQVVARAPYSEAQDYFRQVVEPYSRRNLLASDVEENKQKFEYQSKETVRQRETTSRYLLSYSPIGGVSRSAKAVEMVERDNIADASHMGNLYTAEQVRAVEQNGGNLAVNATLNANIREREFSEAASILGASYLKSPEAQAIFKEEGIVDPESGAIVYQKFDFAPISAEGEIDPHPLEKYLKPEEKARYLRELIKASKLDTAKQDRVMLDRFKMVSDAIVQNPYDPKLNQSKEEIQTWFANNPNIPTSQKVNSMYQLDVLQETGKILSRLHSMHPRDAQGLISSLPNTLEKGLGDNLKSKLAHDPEAQAFADLPEFSKDGFVQQVQARVTQKYAALREELEDDGAAYGIAHQPRLAKLYRQWEMTGNPQDLRSFQLEVETYQRSIGQIPGKLRSMPKAWMAAQGDNLRAAMRAKDDGKALNDWVRAAEATFAANSKLSDKMFDLMVEEKYMPPELAYARLLPIESDSRRIAFSNIRRQDEIKQAVDVDYGTLRRQVLESPLIGKLRLSLLAGEEGKNLGLFNGIVDTISLEYARRKASGKTDKKSMLGNNETLLNATIKDMWEDHNAVISQQGLAYVSLPYAQLQKYGMSPNALVPMFKVAKKKLLEKDLKIEPENRQRYEALGYKTEKEKQDRFKKEIAPYMTGQQTGSSEFMFQDDRTGAPITPINGEPTFGIDQFVNDIDVIMQQKEDSKTTFERIFGK